MNERMFGLILTMVNNVIEDVKYEMDVPAFTCFICMLLEEFCKAKGEDVVEVTEMINTAVKQVNETEGRY